MMRKVGLLSVAVLLLFTGAAFADTHGSDSTDAAAECEAERQDEYADAEADRDEAIADGDNETEAQEEYDQAVAEADEDYQECLADAAEEEVDEEDEDSLPVPESYEGDHIAFDVTTSGAANYSVDGVRVIDSASAGADARWEEFKVDDGSVKLEGDSSGTGSGVELKAADAPSGVFVFEADDALTITVVFPAGSNVSVGYHADHDDDDEDDLEDEAAECESEYQEELADAEADRDEAIADGDNETEAQEEYDQAVADAEAERDECLADAAEEEADEEEEDASEEDGSDFLTVEGDGFQAIVFTEEGYTVDGLTLTTTDEVRLILTDGDGYEGLSVESTKGIANGDIAAGIDVPRRGPPVGAAYGDVNVVVEETETGLLATVESEGDGKTILFSLETGALGDLEQLTVIFDGQPITLADDVADLRETSDGPEYLIILGDSGAEVLVQVPHFSVHSIELQGDVQQAGIPGPSAVLVMAGVLGLAAVVHAVRRH